MKDITKKGLYMYTALLVKMIGFEPMTSTMSR